MQETKKKTVVLEACVWRNGGRTSMTGTEALLMDYIMRHTYSCPVKDDADIDFDKECVGFKEPGCRECIMKHLEELR